MVVATLLTVLFVALAAGVAGDFLMLVTAGIAIGGWTGWLVSLLAERWRARRLRRSPWAFVRPVRIELYHRVGGLVGGGVGLAVALLDALLLS